MTDEISARPKQNESFALVYPPSVEEIANNLWDSEGGIRLQFLELLAVMVAPEFRDWFIGDLFEMIIDLEDRQCTRQEIAQRVVDELAPDTTNTCHRTVSWSCEAECWFEMRNLIVHGVGGDSIESALPPGVQPQWYPADQVPLLPTSSATPVKNLSPWNRLRESVFDVIPRRISSREPLASAQASWIFQSQIPRSFSIALPIEHTETLQENESSLQARLQRAAELLSLSTQTLQTYLKSMGRRQRKKSRSAVVLALTLAETAWEVLLVDSSTRSTSHTLGEHGPAQRRIP